MHFVRGHASSGQPGESPPLILTQCVLDRLDDAARQWTTRAGIQVGRPGRDGQLRLDGVNGKGGIWAFEFQATPVDGQRRGQAR